MKPIINAFNRKNLTFEAPNLGEIRTSEKFHPERLTVEKSAEIKTIINDCMQLLDVMYWPTQINIDLETEAKMIFPDGFKEKIPVSF